MGNESSRRNKLKHPPAMAHGDLNRLFDNIWFVQGAVKMPMIMPMKISRSMTVIKNPSNSELTLVNSLRLTEKGLKDLESLGKVANVLRIAGFHGRDDGFYRERYGAKIYAIKGQFYSRKLGNSIAPENGYLQPDEWLTEESSLPIESAKLKIFVSATPPEGLLFIIDRDGGILVSGDSLQNTPAPDEYVNLPARFMMKRMGFFKAYNVGPGWLQFASPQAAEVRSILDLQFEHVLPAHGNAVIGNAKRQISTGS